MESVILQFLLLLLFVLSQTSLLMQPLGWNLEKLDFNLVSSWTFTNLNFFFSVSNFHYFGKCDSSALTREISISFNCSAKIHC